MVADLFTPTAASTSRAGRLNAGTKLLATFLLSLGLILIKDWVAALTILLLEALVFTLWGARPLNLLLRFWPLLLGTLLTGWSTALIAEKTGETVFHLGFLWVTTDSLTTGISLMVRGLALALPGLLLVTTTDPTDAGDSLAQTARLPARFVLAALAALRLLGILATDWNTLGQARRARGLGAHDTLLRRIRTFTGQAFALLVQAIRRGTRLATTMEARGFGAGPRTWARVPVYGRADGLFLGACLVTVLAGYLVSFLAGTLTWMWL
ncbi:energy-coupling factor transporter transmembrane component T family protein [Rothia nasisuis]|uniref:energy-coupling factor transporter transmembrane component T family protein n=1 Tax=Rothia nasisuis TaxID=2109647 RepID=UPI001F3BD67B|nr:energy-coupling factor transporter transmembrane component T [Rothia nasisuis]